MSRVREVGEGDIDRLIRVYNRMVGSLRDERVRLEEQQQFLSRVLRESPGGILVLDFDRRVDDDQSGRRAPARRPAARTSSARPLAAIDRPLAGAARGAGGRRERTSSRSGAAAGCAWQHGTFVDRGFRRSFFLLEELTEELRQSEKAAYEKLIRMLSHEVNNTVGRLATRCSNSCLSYAGQLTPDDQRRLRAGDRRRHRTDRRS